MGKYGDGEETDLVRQIAELERRVRALEMGPQLGTSSVNRGAVKAVQPDGTVVFEAGAVDIGIVDAWGTSTRRANDTLASYVFSKHDGTGFWAFLDKTGNIIASEDGASGQGLATPWLALPGWMAHTTTAPSGFEVTTSGTFVGLYNVAYLKQHPKIHFQVVTRSSDGSTTGEVRLQNLTFNETIGNVITVTAGQYVGHTITGVISGDHLDPMELEIQARRTAGAGTIGARPLGTYGRQT